MLLYGVRVGLHSSIFVCCRIASMESGCGRWIPLSMRLIVQLRNRVLLEAFYFVLREELFVQFVD